MNNPETFITKIPVRWSDFDQFRHINNVAYLELAQEARVDFMLRGFNSSSGRVPETVVRRMEIDYLRALLSDTRFVYVVTEIVDVGKTSFVLRQDINDEHGHTAATLTTVMVMYDVKTAQPVTISTDARKELQRFYVKELAVRNDDDGSDGAAAPGEVGNR